MTERTTTPPTAVTSTTIGIDIGDRMSHICVLADAGSLVESGFVDTEHGRCQDVADRDRFAGLLRPPLGRRVLGQVDVQDLASVG